MDSQLFGMRAGRVLYSDCSSHTHTDRQHDAARCIIARLRVRVYLPLARAAIPPAAQTPPLRTVARTTVIMISALPRMHAPPVHVLRAGAPLTHAPLMHMPQSPHPVPRAEYLPF